MSAIKVVRTDFCSVIESVESSKISTFNFRHTLLGLLLGAILPLPIGMHSVLRPIWATETTQRALDIVRLVEALERVAPCFNASPVHLAAEYHLARELAAAYRSIDYPQDLAFTSCSKILRNVARDLVELFGNAGSTRISTSIERLTIQMFRSRALILIACRLVMRALENAEGSAGLIVVTLHRVGTDHACLRVDGAGGLPCALDAIVVDLASLLEAVPTTFVNVLGQVTTEIIFPIEKSVQAGCARQVCDGV